MLYRTRRLIRVALLPSGLLLSAVTGCGSTYQSNWEAPAADTSQTSSGNEVTPEGTDHAALGDAAWAERDDADRLRAAISEWEQVVSENPTDHETWVKISRAYYFLTDGHLRFSAPEEMAEHYQHGIRAAERALAVISPDFARRMSAGEQVTDALAILEASAVPALYWRATNLGKWARADGFATLLSFKDEIRAIMTRCMELDRYYFFAGPDRYFGAFFAIAPAYAGGDLERAQEHFDESIRRFPGYLGTRVLYAENYAVKMQNRQLYQDLLQQVIDANPDDLADVAPENRIEQRKAQAALSRIDDLFE